MPTTITLPSKFAEDKDGNKFAPITTPNAVRFPDGTNLNDHLGGTQVTPIISLGSPSGDIYPFTIGFDSSTSKFYQYLWDDNRGRYTWQEIATLEKAFGYYDDGQGTHGFYEIDNGVLSQTLIERLEAGWYSDFAGLYGPSIGQAGVIAYSDGIDNLYRTVSWDETYRWNDKSDFSGDYNDLSNKPTIPTYSVMGASGSSHASGLVPDTPSTAGTTKFLREDGTWQVPTVDVSGKEDKMNIVQMMDEPISTLSPAISTLYMVLTSTLDVTLPTITDATKVQSFVIMLLPASSAPSITIHGTQDNQCRVFMPTDIYLDPSKVYEINCMLFNQFDNVDGTVNYWSVAIRDIGV